MMQKFIYPLILYELIYSEAQFIINEESRLRSVAAEKKADDEKEAERIRIANELKAK